MNYKYIIDDCIPYLVEDGIAHEVDYNSSGNFYVVRNGKTIEDIKGYELFNLYEIERKFNVVENALIKKELEEMKKLEEQMRLEEEEIAQINANKITKELSTDDLPLINAKIEQIENAIKKYDNVNKILRNKCRK